MATKIKIDRAAFPLLRRVPTKDIMYNHSYSAADGSYPCDMTTAAAENSVPNWINAEGMLVLVSTSNTVWTVSPTVLRIEYNSNRQVLTELAGWNAAILLCRELSHSTLSKLYVHSRKTCRLTTARTHMPTLTPFTTLILANRFTQGIV